MNELTEIERKLISQGMAKYLEDIRTYVGPELDYFGEPILGKFCFRNTFYHDTHGEGYSSLSEAETAAREVEAMF